MAFIPQRSSLLFLFSFFLFLRASSSSSSIHLSCTAKSIVKYRVTFLAEWTEDRFYKMYPRVRPPAQWSKVLGRTHDENYTLWREGVLASDGLKSFAEKMDSTTLDLETQGALPSLLDVFSMPPIKSGFGNATAVVFADNRRHFISFAAKIHPSPDWFVGVDSLDLCEPSARGGFKWRESKVVELFPLDAGTDDGFTFTAPNWATAPQAPVSRITNLFPDHEASSFYYPEMKTLPRIGALIFTREDFYYKAMQGSASKVRVADLIEEIGFTTPSSPLPTKGSSSSSSGSSLIVDGDSSKVGEPSDDLRKGSFDPKSFIIPSKAKVEEKTNAWWLKTHKLPALRHLPNTPSEKRKVFSSFKLLSSSGQKQFRPSSGVKRLRPSSAISSSSASLPPSPATYLTSRRNNYNNNRNKPGSRKIPLKFRSRNIDNRNNGSPSKAIDWKSLAKARKDCLVSEWSQWSACSKSCGFGQRTRRRTVTQAASSGGVACPRLYERETCGTMRGCGWKHFSADNWENMTYEPSLRGRRRRMRA